MNDKLLDLRKVVGHIKKKLGSNTKTKKTFELGDMSGSSDQIMLPFLQQRKTQANQYLQQIQSNTEKILELKTAYD